MITETTINGNPVVLKIDEHGRTLYFDTQDADLAEKARSEFRKKGRTTWYAVAYLHGKKVSIHRVVAERMKLPGLADHINRNGLNNCRWNLRETDKRRNNQNRGAAAVAGARGGSRYKGVTRERKPRGYWRSEIGVVLPDGFHKLYLGVWPTQEQAALAYNEAALKLQDTPQLNDVGTDFSTLPQPSGARKRHLESIPLLRALVR